MTNDEELLVLAAKSIGLEPQVIPGKAVIYEDKKSHKEFKVFNSFKCQDDAFNLLAHLDIDLEWGAGRVEAMSEYFVSPTQWFHQDNPELKKEAVLRAVTLCAARTQSHKERVK